MRVPLVRAGAVAALALACLTGCAYYNTFYLAKRYYQRSLDDVPYPLDKADLSTTPLFNRSIDLSKKLIEQYPKSKWVDHAYILWAKSLIGNDDPRQAIKMLEEFPDQHPKSPVLNEATFYLGIAYLRARKYERALEALDRFLAGPPRKELVPFAHLERSRALLALERPAEAAAAAGRVVEHFSHSALAGRARIARAQALFAQKDFDGARADYKYLGRRAATDEDRLAFLLSEADCLEGGRKYDEALALLRDALAHEREPARSDTTGGRQPFGPTAPEAQHYGRLLLRVGTVHLRAGRLAEALSAYKRVLEDYPRTVLGAEAQYGIGYAYETVGDDFDRARAEYARVRDQGPGSNFADQAQTRLSNLERLVQFRKTAGDTLSRAADGEFLLAEQYLFQLDKPDRAIEQYRAIERRFAGSPYEAKALNARAWVLSRRLKRKAEADSLFWTVVRRHAGTEAQLAARDYLEAEGIVVPDSLIRLPVKPESAVDSTAADTARPLTRPPAGSIPLGTPVPTPGLADSLRLGPHPGPRSLPPIPVRPDSTTTPSAVPGSPAPRDTTRASGRTSGTDPRAPAAAPRDTTRPRH